MDLQSLGHAAAMYQQDPRIIDASLTAVQAAPQLILNGVRYFRVDDIVRALGWLAERDARESQAKAAEVASDA